MICFNVNREGDAAGPRYCRFDKDEVIAGRSAEADVVLADEAVSLFHLRLLRKGSALFAVDVGSANGTWVDGSRLAPNRLRRVSVGSRISVGPFQLELLDQAAAVGHTAAVARQAIQDVLSGLGEPPRLEVVAGPNRGLRLAVPLGCTPRIVGRGEECHLQLTDADVSRQHLILSWEGSSLVARDAGSKNGFRVDGVRVAAEVTLHGGEELQLGGTRVHFLLPSGGTAQLPEQQAEGAGSADEPVALPESAEEKGARPSVAKQRDPLILAAGALVIAAALATIIYLLASIS